MDWRPIQEAPRDGRPLLLMTGAGIRLGHWLAPDGYDFAKPAPGWRSIPGDWLLLDVTRWWPLPPLLDLVAMRRDCAVINGRACFYPACDCTPAPRYPNAVAQAHAHGHSGT